MAGKEFSVTLTKPWGIGSIERIDPSDPNKAILVVTLLPAKGFDSKEEAIKCAGELMKTEPIPNVEYVAVFVGPRVKD